MKPFLLVVVLLLVVSLLAACRAGSTQPQVEPAQEVKPVGAEPDTTVAEILPPAAVEAQPQVSGPVDAQPAETAAETMPPAAVEAQPQVAARVFEPQSNSERAVTVQVTPLNLPEGNETLDFEVAFNTHSVDLSFDPAAISVLRDDRGREYPAARWEGSEPGGHHRSGVLKFTAPEDDPAYVEVVLRDVAGVPERVFRWELNF